jgi:hypothetical protein
MYEMTQIENSILDAVSGKEEPESLLSLSKRKKKERILGIWPAIIISLRISLWVEISKMYGPY